jgi:hypothetical protein
MYNKRSFESSSICQGPEKISKKMKLDCTKTYWAVQKIQKGNKKRLFHENKKYFSSEWRDSSTHEHVQNIYTCQEEVMRTCKSCKKRKLDFADNVQSIKKYRTIKYFDDKKENLKRRLDRSISSQCHDDNSNKRRKVKNKLEESTNLNYLQFFESFQSVKGDDKTDSWDIILEQKLQKEKYEEKERKNHVMKKFWYIPNHTGKFIYQLYDGKIDSISQLWSIYGDKYLIYEPYISDDDFKKNERKRKIKNVKCGDWVLKRCCDLWMKLSGINHQIYEWSTGVVLTQLTNNRLFIHTDYKIGKEKLNIGLVIHENFVHRKGMYICDDDYIGKFNSVTWLRNEMNLKEENRGKYEIISDIGYPSQNKGYNVKKLKVDEHDVDNDNRSKELLQIHHDLMIRPCLPDLLDVDSYYLKVTICEFDTGDYCDQDEKENKNCYEEEKVLSEYDLPDHQRLKYKIPNHNRRDSVSLMYHIYPNCGQLIIWFKFLNVTGLCCPYISTGTLVPNLCNDGSGYIKSCAHSLIKREISIKNLEKLFHKQIDNNNITNENDKRNVKHFIDLCDENGVEKWEKPVYKWNHKQLVTFTEWISDKQGGEKYKYILINLQLYGEHIGGKEINHFSKNSVNMKKFGEIIEYKNEIVIKSYMQEIDKVRNEEYPWCIQWLYQKGRKDMNNDKVIGNPKLFVHEKDKLQFLNDTFSGKVNTKISQRFEENSFWIPIQFIKDGDRNYDFSIIKCSKLFATFDEKDDPNHLCWLYDKDIYDNNMPFVLYGYGNVDNNECGPAQTKGKTIGKYENLLLTDCDTMHGDSGADIILRRKHKIARIKIKNDPFNVERNVILGTHIGFDVWPMKCGKNEYWNCGTTMHDDLFRYVKSILGVSCPPRVKIKDIINYESYFGKMKPIKRKLQFENPQPRKKHRVDNSKNESIDAMDVD